MIGENVILPGTGRGTGEAGGGGSPRMLRPETSTARKLRRRMSRPEVLLWQRLRGSPGGVKFRRQHPVGPYVVDFYRRTASLVVEIDGQVHDATTARDAARDLFFRSNGLRVIHILAGDVLRDPDGIAASIVALAASPLHHASHGPPPRPGEDQE